MPLVEQRALDQVAVDVAQQRQRDRRLLETPLAGEAMDLGLAQLALAAQPLDLGAGGAMVGRDLAGLAADPADPR